MIRYFTVLAILGFPVSSHAVVVSDQIESITQYLVMTAPTVKVRRTSDPNTAEITIKPASHTLVSMVPKPFSGNIPTRKMTSDVWNGIFESQEIPASLTWNVKNKAEQGAFLNVKLKTLQGKNITLTATINKTSTATLADKAVNAGNPITYGVLQDVAITLDDQRGRVIRGDGALKSANVQSRLAMSSQANTVDGCVIQPHTDCANDDLSGANLSGVDLSGSILVGTNLSGANLARANLSSANIKHANTQNANLTDVVGYTLQQILEAGYTPN